MKRRSFLKALGAAGASAVAAVVGVRAVARDKAGNGIVSEELLPPIRDPEAAMEEAREAVKKSIAYCYGENVEFSIFGQEITGVADGSFVGIDYAAGPSRSAITVCSRDSVGRIKIVGRDRLRVDHSPPGFWGKDA